MGGRIRKGENFNTVADETGRFPVTLWRKPKYSRKAPKAPRAT